jgi:hypothetical protein
MLKNLRKKRMFSQMIFDTNVYETGYSVMIKQNFVKPEQEADKQSVRVFLKSIYADAKKLPHLKKKLLCPLSTISDIKAKTNLIITFLDVTIRAYIEEEKK